MSFSVEQVLSWLSGAGAELSNRAELADRLEKIRVSRPAQLKGSSKDSIAFFFSREYQDEIPFAHPGILVTGKPFVKPLAASGLPLWKNSAVIACEDPYFAMALVSERFSGMHPGSHRERPSTTQIHPRATVHESVSLGEQVIIHAGVVIDAGVKVGRGSVIYPGTYVAQGVTLGEDTILFANVTLYEFTQIGNRVRIHSGCVIGADGFGYAPKRENGNVVAHQKIFHLGRVIIGDDVEIGANTCIDRGTFGDTVISSQVKIDNHVQIGHNCTLDEGAVICGNTGLAGGASVGKFAYVGGSVGVNNRTHIGDRASVAGFTAVSKDVPAGSLVMGHPARPMAQNQRLQAILNKMIRDHEKKREERREAASNEST